MMALNMLVSAIPLLLQMVLSIANKETSMEA
jgi:hypothetical protein